MALDFSLHASLIVIELALLASACVVAAEWASRQWQGEKYLRSLFSGEMFGLVIFSAMISAVIWYSFSFRFGILAVALGLAWGTALLFPLGALAFYLTLLLTRPWEVLGDVPVVLALPKVFAITVLLSWIAHKVFRKDDRLFVNSSFLCYVMFLLWLVASGLLLGRIESTVGLMAQMFFPSTVIFLLFLQLPLQKNDMRFLQLNLAIALCGTLGAAIFHSYGSEAAQQAQQGMQQAEAVFTRLNSQFGLFGNANDLASLIVLGLPLVFFPFFLGTKDVISRLGAGCVLGFFSLCLWLTQSRGALLAVFLMGFSWWVMSQRQTGKNKKRMGTFLFVAIPLALSFFIFRAEGDMSASSSSRMSYIIAGLGMVKSSPLLGVGLNQYPELYEAFTPSFVEYGKRTAHSSWILVLAETGFPGFILFISIYIFSFLDAAAIRREHPEYLLALIGYSVTMTLLSHSYLFLPYLVLGFIGGAARVLRRNQEQEVKPLHTRDTLRRAVVPVLALCMFAIPVASRAAELAVIPDLDKPFGPTHKRLASSLEVSGARGETISFFLQLPKGSECSAPSLRIEESGFSGRTSFSFLPYVPIKHPSFPGAPTGQLLDPVIPLSGKPVCLSPGGASWLLGEILIDRESGAGSFTGSVQFKQMKLPVKLEVYRMKMPRTSAYPFYTEMTTYWNLLGHFGKWTNGEAPLARNYLKLLRNHRVETLTTGISTPEPVPSARGGTELELYRTPTPDQSFEAMNMVGRSPSVYLGFPRIDREDVGSPKSIKYLQALESTIPTVLRPGKVMMYVWDEPQTEELPKLTKVLKDIRTNAPSVRTMVTTPYEKRWHDLIDIFVPVAEEIGGRYASREKYQELRAQGKEFWWYVSCMSHGCEALADSGTPDLMIDRSSVYIRSIGWLGPLMGTDAFLYYHTNQAYQYYPKRDPWKNQWDFSGNGDGTLTYPGRPGMYGLTSHTPIASLRLKLLRQASYDAQYIAWMEAQPNPPAWWREAKSVLVRDFRSWSKDYWKFKEIRDKVARYLEK